MTRRAAKFETRTTNRSGRRDRSARTTTTLRCYRKRCTVLPSQQCMDTRKSRLGTLVIINGAFVTGKSARLKRVVTSSTGAEVYALSAAAREMVAVRNQLRELQHPIEATSTLRGDNQSSLLVATTPGKHRSSLRHLELHAF